MMAIVHRAEIATEDVGNFVNILTKAGYQCKVWQDGETLTVTVVEFVHPEYTGVQFEASSEKYQTPTM